MITGYVLLVSPGGDTLYFGPFDDVGDAWNYAINHFDNRAFTVAEMRME